MSRKRAWLDFVPLLETQILCIVYFLLIRFYGIFPSFQSNQIVFSIIPTNIRIRANNTICKDRTNVICLSVSSKVASVDDGESKCDFMNGLIKLTLVTLQPRRLNLCTIVPQGSFHKHITLMICTIFFHIAICILYIVFMNTHHPAIVICSPFSVDDRRKTMSGVY
jgi:hypothetical protein